MHRDLSGGGDGAGSGVWILRPATVGGLSGRGGGDEVGATVTVDGGCGGGDGGGRGDAGV